MKVLLIFANKDARDILSFCLETRFQANVFGATSAEEAVLLFLNETTDPTQGKLDLVITDHPSNSSKISTYLSATNSNVPCIICSLDSQSQSKSDKLDRKENVFKFVTQSNILEAISGSIEKFLSQSTIEAEPDSTDTEFCRIKTELLLQTGALLSDVYIRLSPTKLIKLFRKDDVFDLEDYQKYNDRKNIRYLYVRKSEAGPFVLKFKKELEALLKSDKPLDEQSTSDTIENVHETVQTLISRIGLTPEIQGVIKAGVQLTSRLIAGNPRLKQLISGLEKDKKKYLASHSLLLSQMASAMAAAMSWSSEATVQKLCLASFMHDIALSNQRLAMIRNLKELEERSAEFTLVEIESYKQHSLKAAELVRRFNEIPADVDTVVAHHHELPDGTGFPRALNHSKISPLSALFIVAHDLVHSAFEQQGDFKLSEFMKERAERYSSGNFKKVLKALENLKL